MKVLVNDQIDTLLWEEFAACNSHATPFQTPAFYRLLNYAMPSSGQAICVSGDSAILALAVIHIQKEKGIKGFFSRRGLIFGGPLTDPAYPEALDLLLKNVTGLLKERVIYLETRNMSDYGPYKKVFHNNGWLYNEHLNCVLGIESRDQVFRQMSQSRRRQIRLSLEQGATYEECTSLSDLEEFYSLLQKFYSKELKLPLPPPELFRAFLQFNFGKIFIVRHEGRIIGGSVCPVYENRTIYTYYYYGLKDYGKKIFPTHLAVLAAIDYALQNNIGKLDFMGAGKPGVGYGVREYKLNFGCELHENGRFLKIEKPVLYELGKSGLKLARYLDR